MGCARVEQQSSAKLLPQAFRQAVASGERIATDGTQSGLSSHPFAFVGMPSFFLICAQMQCQERFHSSMDKHMMDHSIENAGHTKSHWSVH
jgi:hypothetical protein